MTEVAPALLCSSIPALQNGIMPAVGNRSTHLGLERSAMTSKTTILTQEKGKLERFPDYPPRDDMQNWLYLYDSSILTSLTIHFADEPNVTVASEVPVGPSLPVRDDARIPDLLVVRDGDRELMEEQRGYAIDRQGKAPDFALEVASPTTGRADYTDKRLDYERFGITEYWRFDPSGGEYHDAALAGDLLVEGKYEPIAIETLQEGMLRGYSVALGAVRVLGRWTAAVLRPWYGELPSLPRRRRDSR